MALMGVAGQRGQSDSQTAELIFNRKWEGLILGIRAPSAQRPSWQPFFQEAFLERLSLTRVENRNSEDRKNNGKGIHEIS